jgi:hypothetical protein
VPARSLAISRFLGLACATVLVCVLAACSSVATAQSPSGPVVRLSYCGGSPQVRPTVVGVICATNAITARRLAWSSWGKPISSAIGTAVVDLCAYSDCHTGTYKAVPIVVVASKIVKCGNGTVAYSQLQYMFVGRSPFQGLPAHMDFRNFMSAPHRPSPGDQRVKLTC